MRMDISQRDLQVFLALAEEKSFTRAATKCHLSQSAFSSRIRLLETGLGTTLFDRTTRSVELTNDGRLFEISAQQLYKEFSEILENFQDHAARRKRVVTGDPASLRIDGDIAGRDATADVLCGLRLQVAVQGINAASARKGRPVVLLAKWLNEESGAHRSRTRRPWASLARWRACEGPGGLSNRSAKRA